MIADAAVATATARISVAFVRFLTQRSKGADFFLTDTLRKSYPARQPEIRVLVGEEMERELEFNRKAQERLERDLPKALKTADADERQKAVQKILDREREFARRREQAMVDRSAAKLERFHVKMASPLGAYWKLDPSVKQHTLDAVAPWTVVDGPNVKAAARRWFDGELVLVEAESGARLAVTPKHPVLTMEGWVAAGALHEGQDLVRQLDARSRVATAGDDVDDVPARVEEVFEALVERAPLHRIVVPVAPEDFHGDGQHGEVEVVGADCSLRDWGEADFAKRGFHLGLARGAHHPGDLLRQGRSAAGGAAVASVVRDSSQWHSGELEPVGQVGARDAQPLAQREHGLAVLVGGDHPRTRRGHASAHGDIEAVERTANGGVGDAQLARELQGGLAGCVAPDKIVRVRREPYAGYVYDLQTTGRWFTAGSLVVSNCLLMGERFWPWEVLDHFHPPLHFRCPCHLLTHAEAVERGFIAADFVPNLADAKLTARQIMRDTGHLEEAMRPEEVAHFVAVALREAVAEPEEPQRCCYCHRDAAKSLLRESARHVPVCARHERRGRRAVEVTGEVAVEGRWSLLLEAGELDPVLAGEVAPGHPHSLENDAMVEAFAERLHPRGRRGQWIDKPELPDLTDPSDLVDGDGLEALYDGFEHGGITASVAAVDHDDGETTVTGWLLHDPDDDEFGALSVGQFESSVDRDEQGRLVLHRTLVELHPDFQRQGFATAFYAHEEEQARAAGVDRVELSASLTVGGYSWARAGFEFQTDDRYAPEVERLSAVAEMWGMYGWPDDPEHGSVDAAVGPKRADQLRALRARVSEQEWEEFARRFPTWEEMGSERRRRERGFEVDPGWFQYPHEIAMHGRDGAHWEQDGHDVWLGKAFLLGAGWEAVKRLRSALQEARAGSPAEVVQAVYDAWRAAGRIYDVPDQGGTDEDEASFWADVEEALRHADLVEARAELYAEHLHPRNRKGRWIHSLRHLGAVHVPGEKADPGGSPLDREQRKAYDAGWRSGQNATPAKVEAADARRAPALWYVGFFDAEGGHPKYAGVEGGDKADPGAGPANPGMMFHVAPREARAAIEKGGVDFKDAPEQTLYDKGNYLWENLPDALEYMRFWGGRDLDLYVVDARDVKLKPDPLHVDYAWFTEDPLTRLRRVDPSELGEKSDPGTPERWRLKPGGAVPFDQLIYIAEGAMESAKQTGGGLGEGAALEVSHPFHDDPAKREESLRMSKLAQEISGDPTLRVQITNAPTWPPDESVVAAYDPMSHKISIRPVTTKLSLLHEIAHGMQRSTHGMHGSGHTPGFAVLLRDLYAKHISPEAADTFWGIVGSYLEPDDSAGEKSDPGDAPGFRGVRQEEVDLAHWLRGEPGQGQKTTRTTTAVDREEPITAAEIRQGDSLRLYPPKVNHRTWVSVDEVSRSPGNVITVKGRRGEFTFGPNEPVARVHVSPGMRDALAIQAAEAGFQSVPRYEAWTRERLRALTARENGAKVAVRVRSETLPTLLDEGRVRNAHHGAAVEIPSNRARSETYGASRAELERRWFHIDQPETENPDAYPVYGYVSTDREDLGKDENGRSKIGAAAFGDAKLTLKDHVRPRTTVVYSDSNYIAGGEPGAAAPSLIDDPSELSVSYFQNLRSVEKPVLEYGDTRRPFPPFSPEEEQRIERAGFAVSRDEAEAARENKRFEIAEEKGWEPWSHGDFIETQIHPAGPGQPAVRIPEDIERVDFTGPADEELKERLGALGIAVAEHNVPELAAADPVAEDTPPEGISADYWRVLWPEERVRVREKVERRLQRARDLAAGAALKRGATVAVSDRPDPPRSGTVVKANKASVDVEIPRADGSTYVLRFQRDSFHEGAFVSAVGRPVKQPVAPGEKADPGGQDDDGLPPPKPGHVRLYLGTSTVGRDVARARGEFGRRDHHALANEIEDEFGLPRDAVWNHVRYEYVRGSRARDPHVYTTDDLDNARYYANALNESTVDALKTAHRILNQPLMDEVDADPDSVAGLKRWKQHEEEFVATWRAKHAELGPVILALDVPKAELPVPAHVRDRFTPESYWDTITAGGMRAHEVPFEGRIPFKYVIAEAPVLPDPELVEAAYEERFHPRNRVGRWVRTLHVPHLPSASSTTKRSGKGRKGLKPTPTSKKSWKTHVERMRGEPVIRQQVVNEEWRAAAERLRSLPEKPHPGEFEPEWYARKLTRADVNARQMTRSEATGFASVPDEDLPYAVFDRRNEVTVLYREKLADAQAYADENNRRSEEYHAQALEAHFKRKAERGSDAEVVDAFWDIRDPGQGTLGGYLRMSGQPGSLFEEQHQRIMEAGALIDAEVDRRLKPQRAELRAVKKALDERKAQVKAVEAEEEQASWETVKAYLPNDPSTWEEMRAQYRTYMKERNKRTRSQDPAIIRRGQILDDLWENSRFTSPESHYAEGESAWRDWVEIPSPVQAIHDRLAALKWGCDVEGGSLDELEARHRLLKKLADQGRRDQTYAVLGELREFGGEFDVSADRETQKLLDEVTPYLPTDWITASNEHATFLGIQWSEERGHYASHVVRASEPYVPASEIKVSSSAVAPGLSRGAATLLHELVHRVEHTRDGVRGAEWTFYSRRVTKPDGTVEDKQQLSVLHPDHSYKPHEWTRTDDFTHHYSGKDYGFNSDSDYELLTMGVEDLVTGAKEIVGPDEEYRQWVLGSLAVL